MTFSEIIQGLDSPIIIAAPLGEDEEFIHCEKCDRYVRARPGAWRLHEDLTCELYQQGQKVGALD
jgi:hypothetical protein